MYQIIGWVIVAAVSAIVGGAVVYFWDDIKAWATRMIGYILDGIRKAIEVTSDAIVYLSKQGYRYYKRVEVYVRNVYSSVTRLEYREEEVTEESIPDEMRDQLESKARLKLMQRST